MKYLRTLFTILSWPVYICIAAYLLIAAPLILGYHPVVVLSGSMEPAFPVGSIIYYKETPCEEIQAGEIITFHAGDGGSLVTHRVVENRQLSGEFITKGDANNTEDPNPVAYQDVAGRAAERAISFAGYFVTYGKHPLAIGVMGGILVLGILFDRTAEKEEERDSGKKK